VAVQPHDLLPAKPEHDPDRLLDRRPGLLDLPSQLTCFENIVLALSAISIKPYE
jgi:hypothetical protein